MIGDTENAVANFLGIANTISSFGLLGATGFLLFDGGRVPRWFLYLAATKLGLDMANAGFAMMLVRREEIRRREQFLPHNPYQPEEA